MTLRNGRDRSMVYRSIRVFPFTCLLVAAAVPLLGASSGAVDSVPVTGFAWSEGTGWIDFQPPFGGVRLHPTHLSGFAWSENVGWIRMGADGGGPYGNSSTTDWGVNLVPGGALTGFAWSETVGWIDFAPAFGEVVVDLNGQFHGFAWSENIGWIHMRNDEVGYGVAANLVEEEGSLSEIPTLSNGLLILYVLALTAVAIRGLPVASGSGN